LSNQLAANNSNAKGFLFYAENQGKIQVTGSIQQNTAILADYQSTPFYTQASEGSTINFVGSTITENTFHAGTQPAILNNAIADSVVDFGLGSARAVETLLTAQNLLTMAGNGQTPNSNKVVNRSADGGVIK
jgi:hypothetical protein